MPRLKPLRDQSDRISLASGTDERVYDISRWKNISVQLVDIGGPTHTGNTVTVEFGNDGAHWVAFTSPIAFTVAGLKIPATAEIGAANFIRVYPSTVGSGAGEVEVFVVGKDQTYP